MQKRGFIRGMRWVATAAIAVLVTVTSPQSIAQSPQPVLQRGYDAGVSGANLAETTLDTSNVNSNAFGALFKLPVDDNVMAQPLYMPAVTVPGHGTRNVLYVATMSDTLYAFDADTGGPALWTSNLATVVSAMPVDMAKFAYGGNKNIVGNLGILSTPVIDPSTQIMYVLACTTPDDGNGTLQYWLHAVDITTGNEQRGGPVQLGGTFGGLTFNGRNQWQRASLTLANGQVVIAFGALEIESAGGYSGWVMGYDKHSLQQTGIFATATVTGMGAGVWMSGRPPAVDPSGYAYVFTGNGYTTSNCSGCVGYNGSTNFSESALKLDPGNGMALVDWFTPSVWQSMDARDSDLSSSGPLVVPDSSPSLLAGGGKTTVFYVLSTDTMGHYHSSDEVAQEPSITAKEFRGGPVYWPRSAANGGSLLFNWGVNDSLKSFAFTGNRFASSPAHAGATTAVWPGGILTLSANADQPASGVLWATITTGGDEENNPPVSGELLAFSAENLSQLWTSQLAAATDSFGNFGKLVPPTVANGKVYVATWSNQVVVYGLKLQLSRQAIAFGKQPINAASSPVPITIRNIGTAAVNLSGFALSGANANMYAQTNTCGESLAAAGHCTINVAFTPTSVGAQSATLNVNLAGGSSQSVTLTGTGIVPYTLAPTSLGFDNVTLSSTSPTLTAMLTNTGSAPLPITSIGIVESATPHMFRQTNSCGSSVATGGQCTISVIFQPTTEGVQTASLKVVAGGGGVAQTVALAGSGVLAAYTVTPTALAFGAVTMGTTSAPKLITVANTGSGVLSISKIVDSNPSIFLQTTTCGSSIAVSGNCNIGIAFKPPAKGPRSATLTVHAGGGAAVQTVTLSGTGD